MALPAPFDAMLRGDWRDAAGLMVPRGQHALTRANPAGLTAREIDVLQGVAQGLSKADIAARLYLSQKTVGHHVSSLLHKLEVPTRRLEWSEAKRLGISLESRAAT